MFVPAGHDFIPYARLRAALDAGDLDFIRRNAKQLSPVPLPDALEICLLVRDEEPAHLERATVRWIGRFALEAPKATISDIRLAADALAALPVDPELAMERLSTLCVEHGLAS